MNATYRLSARQRKELLERGTCLHLAIPAPPRRDYDPLAFARLALPEVKGLIVSAEEREVSVRPLNRTASGVGSLLGEIVQSDAGRPGDWTAQVAVIIAEVPPAGGRRPRHNQIWQWPGGAIEIGGKQYGEALEPSPNA